LVAALHVDVALLRALRHALRHALRALPLGHADVHVLKSLRIVLLQSLVHLAMAGEATTPLPMSTSASIPAMLALMRANPTRLMSRMRIPAPPGVPV
jgi:hypothetical protein